MLFISCGFLLAINIFPGLRDLFKLAPLSLFHYMLCLAVGLLSVEWFELIKIFTGKQDSKNFLKSKS
jgi:hypothetical protein